MQHLMDNGSVEVFGDAGLDVVCPSELTDIRKEGPDSRAALHLARYEKMEHTTPNSGNASMMDTIINIFVRYWCSGLIFLRAVVISFRFTYNTAYEESTV
ncbi:hypothetical protein MKX08_001732 [Trichoderma sp. CBMAI-0020]|nr:hypothetical protein MKX08_001732 [Trichoderma sp. CBMAI-0020]